MRIILLLFLFLPFFAGCDLMKSADQSTSQVSSQLANEEYSVLTPGNRYGWGGKDHYVDNVQSIMTKRCASCHSCTAGPCQLNLTSYEGVARGLSKENPYDTQLFFPHKRVRLEDHFTVEQLRKQGFYPVIADTGDPKRNEKESIMYLALEHGEKNYTKEFSEDTRLTTKKIRELGIAQEEMDYQCPVNPREYKKFKANYPNRGMPYGCPALEDENLKTLKDWLRDGGKGPTVKSAAILKTPQRTVMSTKDPMYMVDLFEDFLNKNSFARQAVSRYIYEHSWVANVHFKHNPGEFYRIVRSRTNAPLPIDLIVTEFPTDHPGPGVDRVYYRLEKLDRVIEMKKHVLWRVDEETIDELEDIFFSTTWSLNKNPPYTANPFDWFNAIPVRKRAHYVARYAQLMWQAIGRGSICHGRDPSSVGSDYAWYFTLDPDSDPSVLEPKLGMKDYSKFYAHPDDYMKVTLPNAVTPGAIVLKRAFEKTLRKLKPDGLGIEDVYKDDFFFGLRHETAMEFYSVKEGNKILGYPKYKLVFPYSNHEIFYYRTAVHYRWYGSTTDAFAGYASAIYGRTIGEDLFISLHPDEKERAKLREFYTKGPGKTLFRIGEDFSKGRPSKVKGPVSYEDITLMLLEHVTGKPSRNLDDLNNWPVDTHEKKIYPEISDLAQWEAGLRTITGKIASYAKFVPNVVHIRLEGEYVYTLLGERGHKNWKMPSMTKQDRDPNSDVIRAFKGYIGSFPHLFVDLSFEDAPSFLKEFHTVDTLAKWEKFIGKYKIPRNSDRFWPFVDWIHGFISKNMKEEGAVVDLRNYDIRAKPY